MNDKAKKKISAAVAALVSVAIGMYLVSATLRLCSASLATAFGTPALTTVQAGAFLLGLAIAAGASAFGASYVRFRAFSAELERQREEEAGGDDPTAELDEADDHVREVARTVITIEHTVWAPCRPTYVVTSNPSADLLLRRPKF